jgi:hypothetical protein
VFFDVDRWPDVFDAMIEFRRTLAGDYGVPVRTELKANYLLRGKGPLWRFNLPEADRHAIYLAMMKVQEALELQTFAIVVNKTELAARGHGENPREVAWEFLLQRIERLTTTTHTPAMLVHDEGEAAAVRKITEGAASWVSR